MNSEGSKVALKDKLTPANPAQVKEELGLEQSSTTSHDQELEKQADSIVSALISPSALEPQNRERSKATVDTLGLELQKKAAVQSSKLKDPIKKISNRSEDGGEVGNALVNLRMQVEALDPARFDFKAGWFSRVIGYLPGIGSPLKRYFSKYENAQTIINSIIQSLEMGREQLKRDNVTLTEDQKNLRDLTIRLTKAVELSKIIDEKLQGKIDSEILQSDPQYAFITEELIFPLRQRIMDLQQQLAVSQQSILAMEIVIRNNKELIRGVNRSLNVTVNALQVAVTVALALADQKIVLEKVQALSSTTSNLIAHTAERLKVQGAEIHKMASTTQLDMDLLKKAFADVRDAMEDISAFRQEALPNMAQTILELNDLTQEAETTIKKKEQATKAEPIIPIEF
jgi:uncharacterized protein YaaN involved in tellurite resistance